jgi:hypothetical protein
MQRIRNGAGTRLAVLLAAAVTASTAGAEPDLSGIYWTIQYKAKIELAGGGNLPLTAAGKEAYDRNIAGLKDGSIADAARKLCVPDGPVRVLASPYPFEIVHGPAGNVTILHELNHQIRVVRLDKPLPKYEDLIAYLSYNGHSVGHFEDDTLVIETVGFKEKSFLDATGAPHTDELLTTERLRRISPTRLEAIVTVHDPEFYTQDWQTRFVYELRNDLRIEDYVCGEPHRDISSVPGVRRP